MSVRRRCPRPRGAAGYRQQGEAVRAGQGMSARVYLDWNATAPLRFEARAAMIAAMDAVGNPSSVHAEGRAARAIVERARGQVAAALGADGAEVIFTSGATEAAALGLAGRGLVGAQVEHDAVRAWIDPVLMVDARGQVSVPEPGRAVLQLANSETGVVQAPFPAGLALSDLTQAFGKLSIAFNWLGCAAALVSAHKLGGPKGVGALVLRPGEEVAAQLRGGGQEQGRRAGTENVVAIAGFGAAAQAAARDLAAGIWEEVAEIRNILEKALDAADGLTIFIGNSGPRLPNTLCLARPGWKAETQVMAMDLAGFAVSAGSACSSGKVRASAVLTAMGYDAAVAGSAIRVSLGPGIGRADVERFADAWVRAARRHAGRVA